MVELKRKVTLKTKNSSIEENEEPIGQNPRGCNLNCVKACS